MTDPCVFRLVDGKVVKIHADDILVVFNEEGCEKWTRDLAPNFPSEHLGELTWCAGAFKRDWKKGNLIISREAYVNKILQGSIQ